MKALILIFLLLGGNFISLPPLSAEEDADSVSLQAPSSLLSHPCPVPIWGDVKVVWKGVQDKRSRPEIAEINPSGNDPIPLNADPSLSLVLEDALKDIFTGCGMALVSFGDESMPRLSVVIDTFYMGMDKKIVTQEGEAISLIRITVERPHQKLTADVGYQIETKSSRFQTRDKIEKTLNELLAKTLEQVPLNRTLKEFK